MRAFGWLGVYGGCFGGLLVGDFVWG
jgi:hypothetical protein